MDEPGVLRYNNRKTWSLSDRTFAAETAVMGISKIKMIREEIKQ